MNSEDYKQLEYLLEKLRTELNHSFCVVCGTVHDGYNIAIYGELGHLKEQHTGPTIEAVVHILKTKQSTL